MMQSSYFTTTAGLSMALMCLLAFAPSPSKGQLGFGKAVINYLGSDFLMADGCPPPKCEPEGSEECRRTRSMVRALYSHCSQSEDGQHLGCSRDKMADGSIITIPVYATMCSAMCYEPDPQHLRRIVRCPHPGFRQHNAAFSNLF